MGKNRDKPAGWQHGWRRFLLHGAIGLFVVFVLTVGHQPWEVMLTGAVTYLLVLLTFLRRLRTSTTRGKLIGVWAAIWFVFALATLGLLASADPPRAMVVFTAIGMTIPPSVVYVAIVDLGYAKLMNRPPRKPKKPKQ